jgi:mannose-6-phosphate isomerase class I
MCYGCVTILDGRLSATSSKKRQIEMQQGESFFLPAHSLPIELATGDQSASLTLIVPAGQGVPKVRSEQAAQIFY